MFYAVSEDKQATEYQAVIHVHRDRKEEVVGIALFGDCSDMIIHGFALALNTGLTPEEMLLTVPIHPTSAEEVATIYNN